MYRVESDRSQCIGYGLRAQTAANSLRLDAGGIAQAVQETVADEDVLEAALLCPMRAITVRVAAEDYLADHQHANARR